MRQTIVATGLFLASIAFIAWSQDVSTKDMNNRDLFNPVPEKQVRELSPDRPDKTESPYTVDAGHYQLEMDFANFTYDQSSEVTSWAWNVAPFNIKAGLLNNVDIQLVYDDYLHVRTSDRLSGLAETQSGFGDLTARLKINLWGDNSGPTAFALLPYVKFPTSTDHLGNNAVEGGVIFPLAVKLPGDFDLGLETAAGLFQDDNDNNYHEEFINSITVDHAIVGKVSGYLEFFSDLSTETHSTWVGTIDVGLEFLISENIQFDCGGNFGITPAADVANPFVGITLRF